MKLQIDITKQKSKKVISIPITDTVIDATEFSVYILVPGIQILNGKKEEKKATKLWVTKAKTNAMNRNQNNTVRHHQITDAHFNDLHNKC